MSSRERIVIVQGGKGEAQVLNGIYEQIGEFCGRPHYSKDGKRWNQPRGGFRENMQIWWHNGEWRIGNTGDHWFVLPEDTPVLPEKRSWLPDNSRGVQSPIAVVSVRKVEDNKWIIFAAGATSGLVADAVTHPIDTIRTRLWVQGAASKSTSGAGGTSYRYRGLLNGFITMVRREGISSLFKGFGSVALLTPLAHGLYFGSYEWSKQLLMRDHGQPNLGGLSDTAAIMSAGFFANTVGALVWNPMDVVKQKEQALVGKSFNGPLDGLRQVYLEGGIRRGLMRGYMSGLATYGPFSAIYFLAYERFKTECSRHTPELKTGHFVAGGFLAGTLAAVATAPIDLIKTRIQVCNGYDGVLQSGKKILQEEGLAVFTKGMGARVIWVAPGCAITIAIFEDVGSFLSRSISVLQETSRQH